jgi:two-component sensor histidine kinase
MLSSVLRSQRAIDVNVEIMRAFVRLRRLALTHDELSRRIDELEQNYDLRFRSVFEALRALMSPPQPTRRRIGFRASS